LKSEFDAAIKKATMIKPLLLCAPLMSIACAGSSPPASSPPPAASAAEPQSTGAAEVQGQKKERDDLKGDLAGVDAALSDLNKRLEVARDAVKADLQEQLAALQKRDDELKAQLRVTEMHADAEAEKARHKIHRAIMDLKSDMQHLADRIQP
jgi:chromosome segregation ATPase